MGVASWNNQLEVMKILIDNGASVNYKDKVCFDFLNSYGYNYVHLSTTQAGWTALLWATEKGNEDVVKYLLHSKANTEVKNKVRLGDLSPMYSHGTLCSHTRKLHVLCNVKWYTCMYDIF